MAGAAVAGCVIAIGLARRRQHSAREMTFTAGQDVFLGSPLSDDDQFRLIPFFFGYFVHCLLLNSDGFSA